jgi:hypothetical protein
VKQRAHLYLGQRLRIQEGIPTLPHMSLERVAELQAAKIFNIRKK